MGTLDRGFESALELRDGEVIRWRGPAMRRVGRTWFGGRLYLSDQRLFFCPGALMRGRHGVLRIELGEIASVERVGRRFAISVIAVGGLRPSLRLLTSAGEQHTFAMQRFNKRAGELLPLLDSAA
jgi:hypothetical protein